MSARMTKIMVRSHDAFAATACEAREAKDGRGPCRTRRPGRIEQEPTRTGKECNMTDKTQTEKGAVELEEKSLDQASGGLAHKISTVGVKIAPVGLKIDGAAHLDHKLP
jgi:hypothetical protein